MTQGWLSLHLFDGGDLDRLLLDGVVPFTKRLRAERLARRMFFLRYWNGGPHLRLRLEVGPASSGEVAAMAEAALAPLMRTAQAPADSVAYSARVATLAAASSAAAARALASDEALEPPQPPGAIQVRPYLFDSARYGEGARDVVEAHFCESSELALFLLARSPEDPAGCTALALTFVAAGVQALEMDLAEAQALLLRLAEHAEALAGTPPLGGLPQPEPIARRLRGEVAEPAGMIEQLADAWRAELVLRGRQLADRPAAPGRTALTVDFMHLLNNRLGLGLAAEAFAYRAVAAACG